MSPQTKKFLTVGAMALAMTTGFMAPQNAEALPISISNMSSVSTNAAIAGANSNSKNEVQTKTEDGKPIPEWEQKNIEVNGKMYNQVEVTRAYLVGIPVLLTLGCGALYLSLLGAVATVNAGLRAKDSIQNKIANIRAKTIEPQDNKVNYKI